MKYLTRLLPIMLAASVLSCHAMEELPSESLDLPREHRIEVLQVTDIEPYQQALDGFLVTLEQNGYTQGQNLDVHRVKIDFDVENGGFWDKLGVMLRIRREAERIANAKPDLVLTIGSPATRYARTILEAAHIPVVFTAVANPLDAGCTSLDDAGPNTTGSTLYMDMSESLRIVQQVFPSFRKIGMVHSDDENGIAHVQAAREKAGELQMTVESRQVDKHDNIVTALKELHRDGNGVQAFAIPLDTYYGLRKYEPAIDLSDYGAEHHVPIISLALVRVPGAVLYVGADFREVGSLAGVQAVKILKKHTKPDVLPILRQAKPTILLDPARAQALHVDLPAALLGRKYPEKDGFWQVNLDR